MEKERSNRAEMARLSEGTLFQLFDYQRFENDPQLQALIDGVEGVYGAELSDDDLTQVSAAGELYQTKQTGGSGGGAV